MYILQSVISSILKFVLGDKYQTLCPCPVDVLQFEKDYLPTPANEHGSLREVVNGALAAGAASVQLPSMLLAAWHLTQCAASD